MNKNLISLLTLVLIILINDAVAQPTQAEISLYVVVGRVYQDDGITPQSNASVTLTYLPTGEQLYDTTTSTGDYLFDLSNLQDGYSIGETIKITAIFNSTSSSVVETLPTDSPLYAKKIVLGKFLLNITILPNPTQAGKEIQIKAFTSLNVDINVTIDDITASLTPMGDGNYTGAMTSPLFDGKYTVRVDIGDASGNSGSFFDLLVVDSTPPLLFVQNPLNNSVTTQNETFVSGTTEENVLLMINGAIVPVIGGRFNSTVMLNPGPNVITITSTDAAGNSKEIKLTVIRSVLYITTISVSPALPGETATITASIISISDIDNIVAEVTSPNGTARNYSMSNATGVYSVSIPSVAIGDYTVVVWVRDINGNVANRSTWFGVSNLRRFYGDIITAEGIPLDVFFEFYRPGTDIILNNFTTKNGKYNTTVNMRNYDMVMKVQGIMFKLDNVDFATIDNDPIDMDLIAGSDVDIASANPITGFAPNTNLTSNGSITIMYDPAKIRSKDLLQIYYCPDWTYSNRTCNIDWINLKGSVDKFMNTATAGIINTSGAFMLVEALRCGNTICELNYGESCSTCPLDCGMCPTGPKTDVTGIESSLEVIMERIRKFEEQMNATKGQLNLTLRDTAIITYLKDVMEKQAEDMKLLLLAKQVSLISGYQVVSAELYPLEFTRTSIRIKNPANLTTAMVVNVTGKVLDFIILENTSITLNAGEETDLVIGTYIPEGTPPGNYYGELILTMAGTSSNIPINIRVLATSEKLLDLKIQPLTDIIEPGDKLKVEATIYNLGGVKRVDARLELQLIDISTNEIVSMSNESLIVETTTTVIREINVSNDVREGRYMIKGIARYSIEAGRARDVSSLAYISIRRSFFSLTVFGIPVWLILAVFFSVALVYGAYIYYRMERAKKKRYLELVELPALPQPGPRSGFIGRIAETSIRAFVEVDKLQTHSLVAGATGSGKTVAAQIIVEEALLKGASLLVFDPTAQWSGFLRANKDPMIFRLYRSFHMKENDARAFNGNIQIVKDPNKRIDIKKYLKKGEITVFCLHKLDPSDIDVLVENTIKEVFWANLEETHEVRALFVYDEVHRLLPKFGGSGKGFTQVERAVREFRKWGIGLVLISQVLSDFVGEIKANIGTEVQMRTRYEGDLERIKMKYGEDILRSVVKASVGTGMIQNSEYNKGRPYFVSFRPVLHSLTRLSDSELESYDTYNQKIDELRDKLDIMKKTNVDVFDLELELNLALENVKKGSFDVVKLYLESLEPRIEEAYGKIGEGERKKAEEEKHRKEEDEKRKIDIGIDHTTIAGKLENMGKERKDKWEKLKEELKEEK